MTSWTVRGTRWNNTYEKTESSSHRSFAEANVDFFAVKQDGILLLGEVGIVELIAKLLLPGLLAGVLNKRGLGPGGKRGAGLFGRRQRHLGAAGSDAAALEGALGALLTVLSHG